MRSIPCAGLLVAFGFLAVHVGVARADDSRVFDPRAASDDERLYVVHDVDHPANFDPHDLDKAHWEVRAALLRQQIRVAEGLWPEPAKTPLNAVIHGKIERQGYTIEKVFFASLPGHYVSGNLYRPIGQTGKLPAVLSPHGHWNNGRLYQAPEEEAKKQIETGGEKTLEGARFPMQARCAMLARMGCVVFMYDMVGYGDSRGIEHRAGFTDVEATLRLQSFMGLQTWNSIRAMDFITSLPEVDASRVAVTGASGGATQTLILSALDDRVAVAFPAVMVSTAMQGGCICENSPLLRVDTNNVEIAALFAPKPLGMTSANDWTEELLYRGYPELREIYKLYGASEKVGAWHMSFPHNYNQVSRELMYNWMNKYLQLGLAEPVVEKPFVPVPPAELSVYDADDPRPADSLDVASLRKAMTAASDAQMAELAKNPAEFRRVVGSAMVAMVGDRLPESSDVFVGNSSGVHIPVEGVAIEKGTISRKGGRMATPFVALTPRDWNGVVVIWVHPAGKASLFDETGALSAEAKQILDSKAAILAPDLLNIGEHRTATGELPKPAGKYAGFTYLGYHLGYNHPILAERASDVLSAIALARGWQGTKSVRLIAFGDTGLPALLAEALSGNAIERATLDLNGSDFDSAQDVADERMLPGGLKYGGMAGILPVCLTHRTIVWNVAEENGHPMTARVETPKLQMIQGRKSAGWAVQTMIDQLE